MFGQNKSFGSSSFGSNTGSGLFGQNNQNKGLFGQNTNQQTTSSNLFGNAQKPAGSLFGNTTNNTSNLFGSPQTQSNQSSLFGGQSNANRSLFGGASTTTAQNSSSLFGGNTTGNAGTSSIFGSSNNASSGGGLFGATGSAVTGTTVKFDPPINSDTMMRNGTTQNISTKHMCISAMNKYIDKSMDELRVEDYMANRKTPAAGTTTTGSNLFGGSNTTTNQAGGLFGNNTQQKTGLFGSTSTSSPFGANNNTTTTGSGLFGSNANTSTASNSLFGSKPAGTSLFGNSNTGGSTFGQTTGSSLFGNQQQQGASTSLFGQPQQQQQAGGSLFGNSNTTTGGSLFGQNTQQQQQSSGFNFGGGNTQTTNNAFGQPASTGGSLFGNTATANTGGSLFGSKPATSTGFNFGGSQPTTTNAFGSTNNTGGGLFGNNAAKPGGLFGSTTTGTTGGGLFGSQPQATSGGLFGSNAQTTQPLNSGFGNVAQPQVVVQQQVAPIPVIGVTADVLQMQANMKSLQSQLTYAPYGDSSLLKYNNSETSAKDSPMSAQQRQLRLLAAKKGSLLSPSQESSFIVPPISKVMSDLSPALSRTSEVTKDLNYTSKEAPPSLGRGLRNSTFNPNHSVANQSVHESSALNRTIDSTLDASINGTGNRLGIRGSTRKSNLKQLDLSVLGDSSRNGSIGRDSRVADPDALPRISENERRSDIVTSTPSVDPVQAVMQRHQDRNRDPPSLNLDTTCDEHTGLEPVSTASSATSVVSTPSEENSTDNSAAGVKLSKPDYFSLPTINEMKSMVKNGRVVLEDGLTIGRSSYGSVYWPGKLELKDLVLDEVVVFRHREVTVYPNEEMKPEEGQELNRPAEVTLERIWYTDKKTKKEVRDVVKLAEVGWREHLERQTIRMGASFKDYRAETGSWVFRVEHFSKYGLADDDDEPMEVAPPQGQKASAPLQTLDMNTSVRDVNNQVQRKKIHLTPDAAQQRETVLEIVPAPVPLGDVVTIVRRRNVPGLGGGGADIGREENNISTMTNEFEDDESLILEEGQQPEKKPKLELLNDLEYESSRFIRNMQELKVMPKPREPAHQFNGGSRETKMIGYGKSKLIDLAVVKGRNSRIGWSETGSLVWSSQPVHNEILFGTIDRASDVNEDTLISMLDVNIDHAETARKGPSSQCSEATVSALTSTFATYTDTYSQMFRQYIEIAQSGGYDGHVSVWKLLLALFPAERQEGWSFERGEQISEWLKNEAIKNAPEERGVSRDSPSTAVWNQICVGDVEKAFQLAIDTNQPQLASILQSSIVCPEATIHCFKAQIENWKKCDILHLIPKSTLKCYILMAGLSHYEWTHEGQSHSINCMEGLSWIQALGLHLWYLRQWGGLEEAYDAYQKDVNAERAASNRGDLYGELIKLACESQHSVEVVLDCAAGENPHDHFLQWHVWSVLHSVGFRTMSKTAETRLHRGYAAQLEALKLNNYAMFILQHIDDDEERATAVRSLLNRFGCFGVNYPFEGISGQFDIPPEWIAEAQFSIAKADNDATQLFELAVAAKNYTEMRRLFVDEIAPTAVVAGDNEALKSACILLHPFENQIPEWGATGMVYIDYCRLVDMIENEVDEQHMQETLESLETRLHAPTFSKNPIQKISLQTIGRLLFEYRADKNTLPEWTKLLGHRQLFKIFRDRSSWGIERFTIDFD